MEVSDTAVTDDKEDCISSDENEVLDQSWKKVPHGRPKSGRLWKDPKPVRFEISYAVSRGPKVGPHFTESASPNVGL